MTQQSIAKDDYLAFLDAKSHTGEMAGFEAGALPSWLFDFQANLTEWALRKGRAALFCDCGLGKTPMQLVWAQRVVEHTNKPVIVVAPLAASAQTVREAGKFSIDAQRNRDGQTPSTPRIVVTNYEQLHRFNAADFSGAVCDESSILKNFDGATKALITEFMRKMPYRLLCTATAAPNDYIELGTSSEALGELGYMDMLSTFFKNDEGSIAPLSYASKWRFKAHAETPFWRWLCSWARAMRKPSDLGFSDGSFVLPALHERVQIVEASRPFDGQLFVIPAKTLDEQRAERRATITERCEAVGQAADGCASFVAWCHLNDEGDLLEDTIPGAIQVSGADDDDEKEEKFEAFRLGQARVLITKPKIGAFGLNWQHCNAMSFFPSHSYEQYYQAVRRCWRFGQTREVTVHVISTAGESDVMGNMQRKAAQADEMFAAMTQEMRFALGLDRKPFNLGAPIALPEWMR